MSFGLLGKAEGVGFEPTEAFTSLVFKTRAINHSTTPPGTTLGRTHSFMGPPKLVVLCLRRRDELAWLV